MASNGDLSVVRFIRNLEKEERELHEQYVGEIMIGSMFGAALAIDSSASKWMAGQINIGMKREFLRHLQEQGATSEHIAEWDSVVADRFLEYRQCLQDYQDYEPPWKLGREFFWNVTGVEEYVAMSIKIATLYLLAGRDTAQQLLNQYGPTLVVNLTT